MASQANIGRWKVRLGSKTSPQTFSAIEEVFSVTGFGKLNQLEDATNFDSPPGTMEYIAGLADGAEITIEAHYIPGATVQSNMIDAVDAGETRDFEIAYVGTSPEEVFSFEAVCLGWSITPSPTSKNTITFTIKISGDIS